MTAPSEPRPRSWVFWGSVAVGWGVIAFGVLGLLRNANETHPTDWVGWFVASGLLHDALLAPVLYAVGTAVSRVVPGRVRKPVQAGLVVSGVLVLVAIPLLRDWGARPDNPTLQPHDYGIGLAVVLGVVWVLVGAAVLRRLVRGGRS